MTEIYRLTKEERENILATTTHFNLHYNTTKTYKCVYDVLHSTTSYSRSVYKEVWCVVTNVARAISYRAKGLSIPRDKHAYTGNLQGIGYKRMMAVLEHLVQNDYLVEYLGGYCGDKKYTSVYVFTPKLLSLWEGVDTTKEIEYHPCVVLKDRESKTHLSTRGVKGAGKIRVFMEDYNTFIRPTTLCKDGVVLPTQHYFRSFLDNLETGGRFYNSSGGIQTMPQKERSKLTINNEATVELDFKAMHPSILYDLEWQQDEECIEGWIEQFFGGVYDPYKVDVSNYLKVDPELVESYKKHHNLVKYDPARNLVKYAIMVGLNADSHNGMCAAVTRKLYGEAKEWEDIDNPDLDFFGVVLPPKYKGVVQFPSSDFCNICKLANSPIKHHFTTDIGVKLQWIDSEIMAKVLNTLMLDGVAGFSVHDSVIVPESAAERAEYLMRTAYESVVGSSRFCIIERK